MVSVYGQKVFSPKNVSVWFNRFEDDRMASSDDPEKHRDRPRVPHADETCVTVEGLIREDRRTKVPEVHGNETQRWRNV
jgi:hypothetical protein